MTGENAGPPSLEEQAESLLEEDTEAIHLVSNFDFGNLSDYDSFANWHSSTPFEPLVRSLLLKELEDYSITELHRYLSNNVEAAESLGFEAVPSRTTIGRAWRERITDELRTHLSQEAMAIAGIAWQRGNSMGLQAFDTEDQSDASDRTRNRFINEKIRDVTAEMQKLVFPCFEFDRDENAHYEEDTFLELQSHMG